MNRYKLKAYVKHKRRARHRKGHRIHPPFAFNLVRNIFFEKHPFYHFDEINAVRKTLLKNKETIEITDFGAGSKVFKSNKRQVAKITKYNTTPQKQGELISRLVCHLKPHNIVELGTSVGIGTLYLAKPNSKANIHTIEGCKAIAQVAENTFTESKVENIKQHIGSFSEVLPEVLSGLDGVDLVYFDGHHNYEATLNYFKMCLPKANEGALFVFDDINWSKEMNKAWSDIMAHTKVSVSFDMLRFGLAFINMNVHKQHYKISWP